MVHFNRSTLALVLMASAPLAGHAFAPAATTTTTTTRSSSSNTVQLHASKDGHDNNDIGKQIVGGASAFAAGLVFAARVAFADTSEIMVDNNNFHVINGKEYTHTHKFERLSYYYLFVLLLLSLPTLLINLF